MLVFEKKMQKENRGLTVDSVEKQPSTSCTCFFVTSVLQKTSVAVGALVLRFAGSELLLFGGEQEYYYHGLSNVYHVANGQRGIDRPLRPIWPLQIQNVR